MQSREQLYADAKLEKQKVCRLNLAKLQTDSVFIVALWIYGLSHIPGIIFAFPMIRDVAFSAGLLQEGYPFWCNLLLALFALLTAVPGIVTFFGLLLLKCHYCAETTERPNLTGYHLIRIVFITVMILCGIAIALYPTIIIAAGEYRTEDQIISLFYIFLAVTWILLFGLIWIRPILRKLEENIICCWAEYGFLPSYMLLLPLFCVAVMICLPQSVPLWGTVGILTAALEVMAFRYYRVIRQTAEQFDKIDANIQANSRNPYDPYNLYND